MKIFKKIGLNPININLYLEAFTHTSYSNENPSYTSYERLEFLGDAIVDMVIAEYLYTNYSEDEGEMTKVRSSYVCENALFEYSKELNLSDYIKVGHGEENDGGRFKKVIMADIFESLMGAIYLDLGFDTVKRVILDIVVPYFEDPSVNFFSDYKSALQEYVQA